MKKLLLYISAIFFIIGCGGSKSEPSRTLGNVMPLGDSITFDEYYFDKRPDSVRTGYRNHLWYKLQEEEYEVNFVGSQSTGSEIKPEFDPDNEGHSGWTSYEIAEHVYDFLMQNHANIILLHIGSNDGDGTAEGVTEILNEIDLYEADNNQTVKVVVALVIDRRNQDDILTSYFNANLQKIVDNRIKNGDKDIKLVDMYRGAGMTSSDYQDEKHPNDTGYQKMADVWFNALKEMVF